MPGETIVGRVVGGYRIDGTLGRGGMGVVYRAEQIALGRTVALKLIAPDYAADVDFRERFVREARVAASIEHPHVIPVYEAGESDGVLFLAMRFIDGIDLRTAIAQAGRLEPQRAAAIVSQVAAALDAAHARGLVHRDVKPANVVLGREDGRDHAYLTDFGLTKHMASSSGPTNTGQWVGTIDYAAPEQIENQRVDARTDVYALGCVLYHALTGSVPFPRDADIAKIYAKLKDTPQAPSVLCGTSGALDEVVMRAMSYDRGARYPSAGDLGRAALAAAEGHAAIEPERSVARGAAAPESLPPVAPVAAAPAKLAGANGAPLHAGPAVAPPPHPPEATTHALRGGGGARWVALLMSAVALLAIGALATIVLTSGGGSGSGDTKSAGTGSGQTGAKSGSGSGSGGGGGRTDDPRPTPESRARFSTPRNEGQAFKGAYCRVRSETLYCWTPNDGYTFALGDGPPYRLDSDEAANEGRAPGGYPTLNFGQSSAVGSFSCTSDASGLTCRSPQDYSWVLPRYSGLPIGYAPDGSSLGKIGERG